MAAATHSIASLTLSFGLVSIPVRLYSATNSGADIRFHLLAKDGSRLKQQYVSARTHKVVPRAEMVKGYEIQPDQFVLFTPDEIRQLEEGSSHVVDIVSFIPEASVDPLYHDKAYLLAPDKRGGKPYALLAQAMRDSGRCALAKWAWKARQHVVQIRATPDGLVLQQLRYATEVRSLKDLDIAQPAVSSSELQLALQLIDQISQDAYDPAQFKDEERQRVLAAIDKKVAGKKIVAATPEDEEPRSGQVIDLMDALRASLGKQPSKEASGKRAAQKAVRPSASVTPLPRKAASKVASKARASRARATTPARPAKGGKASTGAKAAPAPTRARAGR